MIDFIKDLVEEAKASENHTAVKSMSYSEMMDAMKKADGSFETFCEELTEYMEKNGCSFSFVAEGTMTPMITVRYHGFESDGMFDGDEFGKVFKTRDVNS